MNLEPLLQRYVRSLTEREQAGDAPERIQDLGTYMDWLLRRQGYTVHRRVFRYDGPVRRRLAGYKEDGVDIIASRGDGDELRTYVFVLKTGDFGRAQIQPTVPGTLVHDLGLVELVDPHALANLGADPTAPLTIVAVHNGDLRGEEAGAQVRQLLERLRKSGSNREAEWWDADKIVIETLKPDRFGRRLDEVTDASLFPPAPQVFARMALDSLVRDDSGAAFDFDSVDRLLDQRLPLDRPPRDGRSNEPWPDGPPRSEREVERALTELSLFVGMLTIDARRHVRGNPLLVLESLQRILSRGMEHARRVVPTTSGVRAALAGLCGQYVEAAFDLAAHIDPLVDSQYALAMPSDSERIDYPFRVLRFAGHFACAGLVALDLGKEDEKRLNDARRFADVIRRLYKGQKDAFLTPVTDDELIELGGCWTLFRLLGEEKWTTECAAGVLDRCVWRREFRFPLPALWIEGTLPIAKDDLAILVEAWVNAPNPAPGFEDGGSELLPLLFWLANRGQQPPLSDGLAIFAPRRGSEELRKAVYFQSWQPPTNPWSEWYAGSLKLRGISHTFDVTKGVPPLLAAFEKAAAPVTPSPAATMGLPAIDWIAAMRFRNPPPMSWFTSGR